MKSKKNPWTKQELKTYILLLCASADSKRSKDETRLIKSKIDSETFKKIKKEFSKDTEEESLKKVDEAIQLHEYSNLELNQLREDMHEIFNSDKDFGLAERNLDRILDNILY